MKLTKRLVTVTILAAALVVGGSIAAYHHNRPVDHHLYAFDPETKQRISDQPLLFLYAVNSQTSDVITYSPVESNLKAASAAIAQTPVSVDAKSTLTGFPASVTVIKLDSTVDRSQESFLPSLTWVDLQGMLQRQFFIDGVDVMYVSDQPLKQSDNRLVASIAVSANRQ